MRQPPRRSEDEIEALLAPERAGIERHMGRFDFPDFAKGRGLFERPYAVQLGPVPVLGDAIGRDALGGEPAAHGQRNRADPVKGAEDRALDGAEQAHRRAIVRQKAGCLGCFQLKILYMQPGGSPSDPGGKQGQRGGEEAGGYGDDAVRPPACRILQQGRQRGEGKACLLPEPGSASGAAGDGMRNAADADGAALFG